MSAKAIAILGSTGSIGQSALDVIDAQPQRFRVAALAAGRQVETLLQQARRFRPRVVALSDAAAAARASDELFGSGIQVLTGGEGVCEAARLDEVTMTLSAIVGAAGLEPTLSAIAAGKDIALANKECLVMAGSLFMDEVARHGVRLIPVDSEHSAMFQSLDHRASVERLVLTASGGPFRGWDRAALAKVTREQALRHPNWSMGPKITVDSATIMNKGLEVIEAAWLFGMPADRISVVVHPESIIHSMVEYVDGSVMAQMGMPDMRTPIAVALAWPERVATRVPRLDLAQWGRLNFHPAPDPTVFPCLELAYDALRRGGTAPATLNAANEVAVAAFLEGRIPFLAIAELNRAVLTGRPAQAMTCLEDVRQADLQARHAAREWVENGSWNR
ncbi:MAG: 1-deoxy-D-xylulose-5-phosphate reductoisomerase [Magnetococcus sp. WYHC-3]